MFRFLGFFSPFPFYSVVTLVPTDKIKHALVNRLPSNTEYFGHTKTKETQYLTHYFRLRSQKNPNSLQ